MPVHFTSPVARSRPSKQFLGVGGRLPLGVDVEQVHEEVVGEGLGPVGEHAVLGAAGVGAQDPQAADQHRHLGCAQRQQLGPVDQQLLGRQGVALAEVVAEPVGGRLERRERIDVGLLLRWRRCGRA